MSVRSWYMKGSPIYIFAILNFVLAQPGGKEPKKDKLVQSTIEKAGNPTNEDDFPIWPTEEFPTSELEISISARNVAGENTFCVVYVRKRVDSPWIQYHRTETVPNNANPDFASKFTIPFFFARQQPMQLRIHDGNSTGSFGLATTSLVEIMYEGKGKLEVQLSETGTSTQSTIIIDAVETPSGNEQVDIQLAGLDIEKPWFEGIKNWNLFLEIHRAEDNQSERYVLVYRTEVTEGESDPKWKRFVLPTKVLSDGDPERKLKFECWTRNKRGKQKRIGGFLTTVTQLQREDRRRFPVVDLDSKKPTSHGFVKVEYLNIRKGVSFLDFIKGGLQMRTTVGIDFARRRPIGGKPNDLHAVDRHSNVPNVFEQAINSIVPVMEQFDKDKYFAVYGFPFVVPREYRTYDTTLYSDVFNLNLSNEPICYGVQGILNAYRRCISVAESGPLSDISGFLYEVERRIRHYDRNYYHVVLILTKGTLDSDYYIRKGIEQIKYVSFRNASVILVGMGETDFKDLKNFVAAGERFNRDSVHFVSFSKFVEQKGRVDGVQLAKEALSKLPRQLVTYMLVNDIEPGVRPSEDPEEEQFVE